MSSVLPKAAAMTSLDSSSTSGSWEVIPDWQIRTDIHPLVCPGMSEQVAPTAQPHECYNYLAPAVVSRHTTLTVPKQALLPLGNNNQRWITPERTGPTEAAANQQSQAQGNYNITAGPALPSGSHFSQVITTGSALPSGNFSQVTTTAAATAKCPPPPLPNDNATTLTAKPKGPKPPPGFSPTPHPTKAPPPTWQQPAREPWQPPSSETWQPRAREPWQPPPLPEPWQSVSCREPWQLPADHNRHQ